MKKRLFWSVGTFALLLFIFLDVRISMKNGSVIFFPLNLSQISVEAQTGTCCPENGSCCVVSNSVLLDYFYLPSGSCHGDNRIY